LFIKRIAEAIRVAMDCDIASGSSAGLGCPTYLLEGQANQLGRDWRFVGRCHYESGKPARALQRGASQENQEMHPDEGKESFSYLGGLSLVSSVCCPIGFDAIFFVAHGSGLHHGLLRAVGRGLKLTFGIGWKPLSESNQARPSYDWLRFHDWLQRRKGTYECVSLTDTAIRSRPSKTASEHL
jgi:hypothetical protein